MNASTQMREISIINSHGMHLRPLAQFVSMALSFPCHVDVQGNGQHADGKSILAMIRISGSLRDKILVRTEGDQALACLDALAGLVAGKFGEGNFDTAIHSA